MITYQWLVLRCFVRIAGMKDIVDKGRPSASLVVPTREYRSPLNDTSDNTRTTKIWENDIFHYPHKSICTFTYLIQVYRKNILARIDKQFPNRLTCYVLNTIAKMFTYRRNLSRFLVFVIYIFTYLIKIHIEKYSCPHAKNNDFM